MDKYGKRKLYKEDNKAKKEVLFFILFKSSHNSRNKNLSINFIKNMHKYMWKNFAYEIYFIAATTSAYCCNHTIRINI